MPSSITAAVAASAGMGASLPQLRPAGSQRRNPFQSDTCQRYGAPSSSPLTLPEYLLSLSQCNPDQPCQTGSAAAACRRPAASTRRASRAEGSLLMSGTSARLNPPPPGAARQSKPPQPARRSLHSDPNSGHPLTTCCCAVADPCTRPATHRFTDPGGCARFAPSELTMTLAAVAGADVVESRPAKTSGSASLCRLTAEPTSSPPSVPRSRFGKHSSSDSVGQPFNSPSNSPGRSARDGDLPFQ
mmetsp:Transcript_57308/g.119820  ORF Transcript_57308/g.119820 Transcript_57308/m.119820 type:complete len:244 (+) Transcript_57308:209-940(+)